MNLTLNLSLCSIVLFCVANICLCFSGDGYHLELQHDLGNGHFTERGVISFTTLRGEEAVLSQHDLNTTEIQMLQSLKESNGIYRVKVKNHLANTDNIDEDNYVMGFCYARDLLASGLNDAITIYTDELGNIICLEIFPQRRKEDDGVADVFETTLNIKSPSPGSIPDTAGFLNKVQDERIKKERADKEPQSFFAKYWMYILPVVFFMMMSNAANQGGN